MEKIEVGEVFTISDENNEENEVEVLAAFTIEEVEYVAVAFADDVKEDTEEDIDIFFLKIDADGDFEAIDSDEELIIVPWHLIRLWKKNDLNNYT